MTLVIIILWVIMIITFLVIQDESMVDFLNLSLMGQEFLSILVFPIIDVMIFLLGDVVTGIYTNVDVLNYDEGIDALIEKIKKKDIIKKRWLITIIFSGILSILLALIYGGLICLEKEKALGIVMIIISSLFIILNILLYIYILKKKIK